MQSRGGVTSTRIAAQRPVSLFLSGPAAGVVGGAQLAQATGHPEVVTIDIGGTSTDVALISDGVPSVNPSGEIAGYTVPISMVGINTIGAGGGSLLWMDASDMMRVGPRSAGSDPGPACYGRGGAEPTITDASLLGSGLPQSRRSSPAANSALDSGRGGTGLGRDRRSARACPPPRRPSARIASSTCRWRSRSVSSPSRRGHDPAAIHFDGLRRRRSPARRCPGFHART